MTKPAPEPADKARVVDAPAGYTATKAAPRTDPSKERLHAARPWKPKGRR
jgi:hypothetical protein